MRSYTAVINPAAGGGPAALFDVVARLLRDAGAIVLVEPSRSIAHARQVACEAALRGEVVIAVGGDGMVGCLGDAVVRARGVLGIVPAGRGNDFARQLRLPAEPAAMARVLLDGAERAVDVIEINGRIVLGSVYAGIDSVANAYANRSRFLPQSVVYEVGALRALLTWRPATYRVTIDGIAHAVRGYTVVAANSGYYGNGQHIAPDATMDDGLLDVVLVGHVPRLRFVKATLRELPVGSHVRLPQVTVLQGRTVHIEADRALPAFGDGERLGQLPVTLRVRRGALRLIAP